MPPYPVTFSIYIEILLNSTPERPITYATPIAGMVLER
jgi:hypothetical protein